MESKYETLQVWPQFKSKIYLNGCLLGFIRQYLILTRLGPKAGQFCLLMLSQSNVLMEKTSQKVQHPDKELTKSVTKYSVPPTTMALKLTADQVLLTDWIACSCLIDCLKIRSQ